MVDARENERMTRVGRGTPAGELLRRYWHPVATEEQLAASPVMPVRLLGEDLALFLDASGRAGLVDERCPHRGASLAYGFADEDGLRCPYHGWLFDTGGTCLETPNTVRDSEKFREGCTVRAYPVEVLGGLVFAYLGPAPAPAVPRWDVLVAGEGDGRFRDIGYQVVPCNWLQIMENSVDPLHVEWLHGHLFDYHLGLEGEEATTAVARRHVRIGFDQFDHGIIKRRLREGQPEDHDDWTVGHPAVFPNILKVGGAGFHQLQIRVPMDDVSTLHFWYTVFELPPEYAAVAEEVRGLPESFETVLQGPDGRYLMNMLDAQDVMAWVTQGPIANRAQETLLASDRGVIMYRKLLKEQLAAVESGETPMNVFDPEDAPEVIPLPIEDKQLGLGGGRSNPLKEYLRTQSRNSPRLQAAIAALDRMIDARPPVPTNR